MKDNHSPIILCILDGWGHREEINHNAIAQAKTPNFDRFLKNYPHSLLKASAHDVGLPEGQMGNSEVGHMNIGAGRIIMQDLPRIDAALNNNEIIHLTEFQNFTKKVQEGTGVVHLLGLLSPGGVHSHQNHIIALAKAFANEGLIIYLHLFLDGRDTSPNSGKEYLKHLVNEIDTIPSIKIATIGGRYFGMDRDKRWDRVEKAYQVITAAQGPIFNDPLTYVEENYTSKITDEFIPPALFQDYQGMHDGDGLFIANFRADRVRQILSALVLQDFQNFQRSKIVKFSAALGLVEYSENLNNYCSALFSAIEIHNSLGEVVANAGFKQLRIAETEKYAHVTFFFNGGQEAPFPQEDRILVPSPKVATYDLQPEMSAKEVTQELISAIHKTSYDLVVVNYANTDMVGHSGDLKASIQAVECVDQCLGELEKAVLSLNGTLLITADHGNAEQVYDEILKEAHTAHTMNPVPFLCINNALQGAFLSDGKLSDIAPTILEILGLPKPPQMTGKSLLKNL
ncbi:phosphoglyceromutase [Candidatus Paracaedimonas acanthamoebae]|nr:phosphoglyceromutase [Candidatus Paracaedimonas acanthamoebae]